METKTVTPRFQVGDRIIVVLSYPAGKELVCPIEEVRTYPITKNILYIIQYGMKGHQRCVVEKDIDENGKTNKTSWH